ncbi:nuclease-related domain-containing protein [Psychrobacillus sp. FJAT-51614]|uniref:Nuclease-related domain-containing protein n=1 Tax=Psychrobacillus mangrovi TaxID=3117745 RepID=A0ABU8F551_9BACI
MIIKKRSIEHKYMGLKMLYHRLPKEHAMKSLINSRMFSAKAGIIGETIVEEIFDKYQFPFECRILHDVSLTSNGKFQMDTVFITPYGIVILECKNIIGELSFQNDPACLFRRLENGQEDTFESPEEQVNRNIYLLREWLKDRGISLPVSGVIVFSTTKSKIVKPPDHVHVIYATSIPVYLRSLRTQKEYMSANQMDYLAKNIIESHQSYLPYPMCKNWGINPSELITGVQCGKCERFGMDKLKAGWYCLSCGYIDRQAHEKALRDWFGLISNSLTNRECRKFLHINSTQTSLRIIESMNLRRIGNNNKIIYQWKWE